MSESKVTLRCPKHNEKIEVTSDEALTSFIEVHRWCGCLETYEEGRLTGTYDPPEDWMN
jgi:hypothetical protein